MDKLKLTGRNLGRVCNSKPRACFCICHAIANIAKWSNLKLKTWPKQLLGSLPLAFALPDISNEWLKPALKAEHPSLFFVFVGDTENGSIALAPGG